MPANLLDPSDADEIDIDSIDVLVDGAFSEINSSPEKIRSQYAPRPDAVVDNHSQLQSNVHQNGQKDKEQADIGVKDEQIKS